MADSEIDDFTVRIRFRIPVNKLAIEEPEIPVGVVLNGEEIVLKSADLESPIKDSEWLVLVSRGWKSEEDAKLNSKAILDSLCRSLSFHNLSADVGRRTPGGGFFVGFLEKIESQTGRTILNDERGIMVYPTELNPMVARTGDVTMYISVDKKKWVATFRDAIRLYDVFTPQESMAFDLFTMAHHVRDSADARFVLLFSALETLLKSSERPLAVREHVDILIQSTLNAGLPKNEKDSLVGTLKWMRNYSIRAAGRDFVQKKLGDTDIVGFTAAKLFIKCYEMRNRLVHGQKPFADWREVSNIVAPLELMISKLLSGRLANEIQD